MIIHNTGQRLGGTRTHLENTSVALFLKLLIYVIITVYLLAAPTQT